MAHSQSPALTLPTPPQHRCEPQTNHIGHKRHLSPFGTQVISFHVLFSFIQLILIAGQKRTRMCHAVQLPTPASLHGRFTLYRLRTPDTHKPLLISNQFVSHLFMTFIYNNLTSPGTKSLNIIESWVPPAKVKNDGHTESLGEKEEFWVRSSDGVLEKEKEDHQKEKGKEGARSFMGSVRRIRLSGGGDFVGVGGGGPPACIPPLPTSLPPLSCASQVSLKIPSSMATPNTASGQRSTSSHTSSADLRGAASLSSPSGDGDGSGGPTAPATPVKSNSSSRHSSPPSISSSTKRRPRTPSNQDLSQGNQKSLLKMG